MLEWFLYRGMIDSPVVLGLLFLILFPFHFVADFMLQNDEEAKAKSSSNKMLARHVTKYTIPFVLLYGPLFGIVTFISHFMTDYVSSRLASKAFMEGRRHDFFVIVGFDQMMHTLQLILTFVLSVIVFGVIPNGM